MIATSKWAAKTHQLKFTLRLSTSRVGIAGWTLACAILVLSLFDLCWVLPAVLHRAALETPAPTTSANPRDRIQSAAPSAPEDGLAAFYHSFPPESLMLNTTAQLNSAADDAGVHISQADYHLVQDPSGLERADIALTAHATYPKFRQFTATVLTYFPTTALDGLAISRNSATDGNLEIQFHFSLFVRPIDQ